MQHSHIVPVKLHLLIVINIRAYFVSFAHSADRNCVNSLEDIVVNTALKDSPAVSDITPSLAV